MTGKNIQITVLLCTVPHTRRTAHHQKLLYLFPNGGCCAVPQRTHDGPQDKMTSLSICPIKLDSIRTDSSKENFINRILFSKVDSIGRRGGSSPEPEAVSPRPGLAPGDSVGPAPAAVAAPAPALGALHGAALGAVAAAVVANLLGHALAHPLRDLLENICTTIQKYLFASADGRPW